MEDVIVVAGGPWQEPIICYLKRYYRVHVINPVANEVTKLADFHICCDVKHIPRDCINFKPKFVTSDMSDVAVHPVAMLSEWFRTPGNSLDSIRLFTNKMEMAKHAGCYGIPTQLVSHNHSPLCIIKPIDANASRGFHVIEGSKQVADAYRYSDQVVVQPYLEGDVVVLDGICIGGRHQTLTHARKEHFRPGIASAVIYPSGLSASLLREMAAVNDGYVNASGLSFALTHAEYIVQGDRFYLLEIAARGGGFAISSDIVPWVSGIQTYYYLHAALLGQTKRLPSLREYAARLQFFEFGKGMVTRLEWPRDLPGVVRSGTLLKVGERAVAAKDGGTRQGYVLILAKTEREVDCILEEVKKRIVVEIAS